MPDDPTKASHKAGPGQPPVEHRWKKGCPSPNPKGRPPKRQIREMQGNLEEFLQMICRVGSLSTTDKSGSQISLMENAFRVLNERAFSKEPYSMKALEMLLGFYANASDAKEKLKQEGFEAASKYKAEWNNRLAVWKAKGVRYNDPVPHPDDIILKRDLTVEIVGPTTREQYTATKKIVELQDGLKQAAIGIKDELDDPEMLDWAAYMKRRWNKYNKLLPPRLRVPFPYQVPKRVKKED